MRKTKIYRALVVLFLIATLFGSSAIFSITATEVMLAIALVVVVVIVILMYIKPHFSGKN